MKFTIQQSLLMASVTDVMKAISSRTAIPILTGMKIEVKEHGIILTGSDSDISIESYIPAETDGVVNIDNIETGSIILHARYFPEIIRKLPENQVVFEADDLFKVTIQSGKAKFNLNGQDAEEYPQLPNVSTDNSLEIPIRLLKSMIKQTSFAVSTIETRPILTGVNMTLQENNLSFTATDSHRLASKYVPVNAGDVQFVNIVIPGKSINELYKILDDSDENIQISVTNNQILFKTKHINFYSRLLDGNYPQTSRLIPDQVKTVIHAKTKDLIHTIDRASLLAKEDRNNVVKLSTCGQNALEISSNSPEIGNVTEDVTVLGIEGEELKISFSSKYMLDALKALDVEDIKIDFTGAMRPFILQPTNDEKILQLILPVRTY